MNNSEQDISNEKVKGQGTRVKVHKVQATTSWSSAVQGGSTGQCCDLMSNVGFSSPGNMKILVSGLALVQISIWAFRLKRFASLGISG